MFLCFFFLVSAAIKQSGKEKGWEWDRECAKVIPRTIDLVEVTLYSNCDYRYGSRYQLFKA